SENDERLINEVCIGFSISGKPIEASLATHDVATSTLLNENELFNEGKQISFDQENALAGAWLKSSGKSVLDQLEAKVDARHQLLSKLGFQEDFTPERELADALILSS